MYKLFLLHFFLLIPFYLQSQIGIVPFGGTGSNNNIHLSWTGGEVISGATETTNNLRLVQGIQQPNFRQEATNILPEFDKPQEVILTPGSMDGMNDVLAFPDIEDEVKYPHNEITIFNRWGQMIYHAKPYLNDWNGVNQNGKDLPEGTYYFVLKLNVGEGDIAHGSILVLR